MKKAIWLLSAVLVLSFSAVVFADSVGVVSKVEGNKIVVKNESGKEITITGNWEDLKGLKTGDKITIKTEKAEKPAKPTKRKAIEGC